MRTGDLHPGPLGQGDPDREEQRHCSVRAETGHMGKVDHQHLRQIAECRAQYAMRVDDGVGGQVALEPDDGVLTAWAESARQCQRTVPNRSAGGMGVMRAPGQVAAIADQTSRHTYVCTICSALTPPLPARRRVPEGPFSVGAGRIAARRPGTESSTRLGRSQRAASSRPRASLTSVHRQRERSAWVSLPAVSTEPGEAART
ncbi:hypothetical protein GCM10010282_11070 [Streptomyces roseolus]|nr:hypothetical protein GCM10010282_11070 [Streptomyces roseolus]